MAGDADAVDVRRRCYMDFAVGGRPIGRVLFELFYDDAPKTCENFRALCTGERGHVPDHPTVPMHYKGSTIHRVIAGFVVQGGDFTAGDGSGGWSIWGQSFEDETFRHSHESSGLLSMANSGPNTNCSQFFITTTDSPHLDQRHVVFGRVLKGMGVVRQMEHTSVGPKDRPVEAITIVDCGDLGHEEDDGVFEDPRDPYEDFPQDSVPPLSDGLKLEAAKLLKGLGNEHFKEQELPAAVLKYEKALRYLSASRPAPEAQLDATRVRVACLSNLSQCWLKLKQFANARKSAEAALKHDPSNAKVLFRLATALYELDECDLARTFATRARDESPDDKGPAQLLQKLKARRQQQTEKMKRMFG
eukprot:TRINITY_DN2009_c4_g1_i1.p1 TRINITY_DN2009_c4_g1~~TRINITY_DN2009_c4_g1_i1.p1  ORF type:complete len:375 (+),score=121.43 TRINITY_DN2009_c4_g1_i1:47-1126(+)